MGCLLLVAQRLKRQPAMQETWVRSLGQEGPLEKEMATHSSILAWRIPWMEEPGGLQSTGSQRVRHDWATSLTHSPTPVFWPGEFHELYSPWVAKSQHDWATFTFTSLTTEGKHIDFQIRVRFRRQSLSLGTWKETEPAVAAIPLHLSKRKIFNTFQGCLIIWQYKGRINKQKQF